MPYLLNASDQAVRCTAQAGEYTVSAGERLWLPATDRLTMTPASGSHAAPLKPSRFRLLRKMERLLDPHDTGRIYIIAPSLTFDLSQLTDADTLTVTCEEISAAYEPVIKHHLLRLQINQAPLLPREILLSDGSSLSKAFSETYPKSLRTELCQECLLELIFGGVGGTLLLLLLSLLVGPFDFLPLLALIIAADVLVIVCTVLMFNIRKRMRKGTEKLGKYMAYGQICDFVYGTANFRHFDL